MKLQSLATKNFKKLGTFECQFTDGLNVIVGENAAGKSTVLKAVLFGLYGNSALPGKAENIITWGQRGYQVQVTFSVGKSTYCIVRTGSKAETTCDGILVASGKDPCTRYVEQLLGLNHKEYKTFTMATQHNISQVLDEGATSLARKIEQFSGLQMIDQVQQLANERARRNEAVAEGVTVTEETLTAQRKQAATLQSEATQKQGELEDAQQEVESIQAEEVPESDLPASSVLEKQFRKRKEAEQELKTLQERVQYTTERLKDAKESMPAQPGSGEDIDARITAINAELHPLQEQVEKERHNSANRRSAQTRLKQLQQTLEDWDAQGTYTDEQVKNYEAAIAASTEQWEDFNSKVANLEAQKAQAEQTLVSGVCPACERPFDTYEDGHIESVKAQIASFKHQIDDLKSRRSDLHFSLKSDQKSLNDIKAVRDRQAEARESVEAAEKGLGNMPAPVDLSEVYQKVTDLTDERAELTNSRKRLKQSEEAYEEAAEKVRRLMSNLAAQEQMMEASKSDLESFPIVTQQQIEDSRQDEKDIAAWKANHQARLSNAQLSLKHARETLHRVGQQLAQAEQAVKTLEGEISKKAEAEQAADKYRRLSTYLKNSRHRYMAEVWDSVLAVASKQVAMSSGNTITAISYKDGGFLYEEEGMMIPVEECSGAQRGFIGVAVRIGLCRALYGADNVMMFDEPTESMTEDNAVGLTGSLSSMSAQAILITHRETDQALATNVIEIS